MTYLDVSTGEIKAALKTKIKSACSIAQNPQNASISVGSPRGIVSVFIPSQPEAAMKINCHNAQVKDMGFSSCGKYMASVGSDSSVKIWDVRKTYSHVGEYFSPFPVSSLDVSQKNVLALGGKNSVMMFKNWTQKASGYLKHVDHRRRQITSVQFCPYEDFLGVGLQGGFSSIVVPGSCFVNFDSFTHNVHGIKAQTRENAVQKLLEKLPMESIVLNPGQIGKVDPTSREVLDKEKEEMKKELTAKKIRDRKRKKKSRVQNWRFKQMKRNDILREQVREDKFARKELYKAEEKKRMEEGAQLNGHLGSFVKMGRKRGRLIFRENDFGQT